ncbi:50S ribosomal protein L9 [Sphingomonas sabuli]|uniref:Large ribosomal subunit protein bL9 n=1 Tax=Sphingomonas sabuli TaxID=2764186 RepID=A0A7G9L4J6_9SPHN|nr:50S ribosomal protein L9 [Sphingomonas sabuli]QNM83545.1 50S ribosomal protein L9 [Sphingomonas sabuli]
MDVILLERVEKLGGIGDVVTVKNGFARNYLLPNKKALRANEANKKVFEANRAKIESDNAEKRTEAEKDAKSVDGKTVQLIRQASNTGQLYGSVSARDIVEALDGEGAKVTKSQINLARPIKAIGMHDVKVALHPEVSVTVHVNVARSPEEAELQAQGIDVIAQMFEEQAAPLAAETIQAENDAEAAEAAEAEAAKAKAARDAEKAAADAAAEAEAEAEPAEETADDAAATDDSADDAEDK